MLMKISDVSNLVTATVLRTKTGKVENKRPAHDKYISTTEFNKMCLVNIQYQITTSKFSNR